MSSEAFLRRFHATHAGITSRALARGGSYERLAARVPAGARVLDLACGDGYLLERLPGAIGLDVSREELALARRPETAHLRRSVVQGRAQALPFADAAFDAVVCHLAFMLVDEPERVVGELARVLAPGGAFHAVLGGGPTATGRDAFHEFLALARPHGPRLGDPRATSERGWRELFGAGWQVAPFERWEIDLSGTFDEVWCFLSAGYQPHADIRAEFAARFPGRVPCTVVMWCATARRE